MHPVLFEIPGWNLKIHAYGVMIFLACGGALWITAWRVKRLGLRVNAVYELATWLFLGGVVGARALFVIRYPGSIHGPLDLIQSWQGGNVFYGCIMGGLAGSLIYWWRHPFPFWPMADAVAPALAVGVTLGRLGCFLNGCCYGAVCDHAWAVRFPAESHAWIAQVEAGLLPPAAAWSLPVHPTQLYAAVRGAAHSDCSLRGFFVSPPRWRNHGTRDDSLLAHAVADRKPSRRRTSRSSWA